MTENTLSSIANRLEIIELTAKYAYRLDTHQLDLLMEHSYAMTPTWRVGS